MKKISMRQFLASAWRILTTTGIVTLGIAVLLFSRLETLVSGYSHAELATAEASSSIETILSNPINAPYKLVVLLLSNIIHDPLLATRLTSALFGALSLVLFYLIIRKIHSKRTAFLGSMLLACSAWFLHAARYGTAGVMLLFTVVLLVYCGSLLMKVQKNNLITIAAIFALAISIYVPGMLWFVAAGILVRRGKDIKNVLGGLKKYELGLLIVLVLAFVVAPVTAAIFNNSSVVLEFLGLPSHFPSVSTYCKNLLAVPISLIMYSRLDPATWLGHLPLLDIPSTAFFILGLYYYLKSRKLDRAKLLALFMIFASLLIAFGGDVTNAILIPAVYICIAGGVALLIRQWFTVFPKNPLAQTIGITLLAVVIFGSIFYNLRAYFVAWPNWQPTKAVFTKTDQDLIQ